ncbi:hypothetical protein GGF32_005985 [Allomyces javanicus]|nr:hypothetical protein GGF32_005985 [Allomyces javanicus]
MAGIHSSDAPPVRRTRSQLAAAATKAADGTKPQDLIPKDTAKLFDRVRDAFKILNNASAPDSVGPDARQLKELLNDLSDESTLAAVLQGAEPDLLAQWVYVARTASVVVVWARDERPVAPLARVLKHAEARLAGTPLLARTAGTTWTEVWFEVGVGHVVKVLLDVEDGCLFQAVHERTLIHALDRLHQAMDAAAATDPAKAVTMATVASDALHALFALIRTTQPDPWRAHALPLAHLGLHFLHIALALPSDSRTPLQRTWGHLLRSLASAQDDLALARTAVTVLRDVAATTNAVTDWLALGRAQRVLLAAVQSALTHDVDLGDLDEAQVRADAVATYRAVLQKDTACAVAVCALDRLGAATTEERAAFRAVVGAAAVQARAEGMEVDGEEVDGEEVEVIDEVVTRSPRVKERGGMEVDGEDGVVVVDEVVAEDAEEVDVVVIDEE